MKVREHNRTKKRHRGCRDIQSRVITLKMNRTVKIESFLKSVAQKLYLLIMKRVGRKIKTSFGFATI
jgi:hypothetical protein